MNSSEHIKGETERFFWIESFKKEIQFQQCFEWNRFVLLNELDLHFNEGFLRDVEMLVGIDTEFKHQKNDAECGDNDDNQPELNAVVH